MKLYELSEQYSAALSELTDADLPAEVIADTLEGLQGDVEEKSKNVAYFIGNLEAEAAAIEAAAKQMLARAKSIKTKAANAKDYLLHNMQRCEISEISCPHFVIKVKQCPPSVVVAEGAAIPDEYMRPPKAPEPDKTKLKNAILKEGMAFDGVSIINNQRLEIK